MRYRLVENGREELAPQVMKAEVSYNMLVAREPTKAEKCPIQL